MAPTLSVLIPTTGRREEMLARVEHEFHRQHDADVEVLIVAGLSWGYGLNQLARRAKGDYWYCGTDDTLPHEGWFDAARPVVDSGKTPASRYFRADGEPLHPMDTAEHGEPLTWCRAFLLTPDIFTEVGEFIDTTWWADINYSERLNVAGYPIVGCDGYSFTHLDGERDWLTIEEENRQRELYEAARA